MSAPGRPAQTITMSSDALEEAMALRLAGIVAGYTVRRSGGNVTLRCELCDGLRLAAPAFAFADLAGAVFAHRHACAGPRR